MSNIQSGYLWTRQDVNCPEHLKLVWLDYNNGMDPIGLKVTTLICALLLRTFKITSRHGTHI